MYCCKGLVEHCAGSLYSTRTIITGVEEGAVVDDTTSPSTAASSDVVNSDDA